MMSHIYIQRKPNGFTLIEMAMVLLIVGLLLGGLLPTISSQVEQRRITETNAQLEQIREALIGYAIINGRLPCPASSASTTPGTEDPSTGGSCNHPYDNNSYVPAVTLGLSGTDSSGLIEDAWGNPIRYAISQAHSQEFTTANGMHSAGISSLSNADLKICDSAGCTTTLTSNAIAVIYSTGKNGASGGTGTDEAENPNVNHTDTNKLYVSHPPSSASGNEFDDIVTWISPNVLANRMVSAGTLP
jgi:prepilin-type N-terminal cleavage/methylation domain-containing protein